MIPIETDPVFCQIKLDRLGVGIFRLRLALQIGSKMMDKSIVKSIFLVNIKSKNFRILLITSLLGAILPLATLLISTSVLASTDDRAFQVCGRLVREKYGSQAIESWSTSAIPEEVLRRQIVKLEPGEAITRWQITDLADRQKLIAVMIKDPEIKQSADDPDQFTIALTADGRIIRKSDVVANGLYFLKRKFNGVNILSFCTKDKIVEWLWNGNDWN